jgi:hypothetical protein
MPNSSNRPVSSAACKAGMELSDEQALAVARADTTSDTSDVVS